MPTWNYEFSLRQRLLNGRLGYGLNVFYLNADNLITTKMVDGRPLNVNTGSTENSGFELLGFYAPVSRLRFDANYSFLHTSRIITAAPKHKLYMGADWQPGRFILHSGLRPLHPAQWTAMDRRPPHGGEQHSDRALLAVGPHRHPARQPPVEGLRPWREPAGPAL